jgi:hypothetical protein
MTKGGRPKARAVANASRTPKAAPPQESTQGDKPLFCFAHADRSGDERWAFSPPGDHAQEVLNFLCEMAKLRWSEIERQQTGGKNRHRKHHSYDVGALCPDAQASFGRAGYGETFGETIFRFRLAGTKRLWGFRDGRTFHVAWWDRDHQVSPADKN